MEVMNEQDTWADEMSKKEQLKYTEYSCIRYHINVRKLNFLKITIKMWTKPKIMVNIYTCSKKQI